MHNTNYIHELKWFFLYSVNSDELRVAAIAKRKKEIADLNYKIIQEKENMAKEQKVKNREMAYLKSTELIKSQVISNVNKIF